MSEFKFSCPKCGQKMAGEDQYVGAQIICPACQGEIVVPQPMSAGRLQVKTVAAVTAHAPPPPPPPVFPTLPAYVPKNAASDNSKTKMIVTVAIICLVVLCPIIFFFAFPDQVSALESKFGFANKKVDPNAGGGELGHIAELNAVLVATDPDRGFEDSQKAKALYKKKFEASQRAAAQAEKEAAIAEANIPLGEVSWNLNPSPENIPTGKPHGSISKTNFVADVVRLENQANQYLLTLRQGTNDAPDCELLVYLQLKPDEQIEGKNWTISASQKTGAPRIVKKWKANPKFAPQQKILPAITRCFWSSAKIKPEEFQRTFMWPCRMRKKVSSAASSKWMDFGSVFPSRMMPEDFRRETFPSLPRLTLNIYENSPHFVFSLLGLRCHESC